MAKASKVTTTVQASKIDALTAPQVRMLERAVKATNAVENVSARTVYAAVTTAHTLKTMTGLSGNGVAELIAIRGGASRATTARLLAVGDVLTRDELADIGTDAATDLAGHLYYVAGRGRAYGGGTGALTTWLEGVTKGKQTPVEIVASAEALRDAVKRAESAPSAPAKRPVQGEAANGGKPAQTGKVTQSPVDAETASNKGNGPVLKSATVGSLIAELKRRVSAKGFTADAVILAAFDDLAAAVEAVALAEPVTAE